MTTRSLANIGAYMNKDRTNVEHGYRMICQRLQEDDTLLSEIENIKREILQYVREHNGELVQEGNGNE
jgi:hypothetical protein